MKEEIKSKLVALEAKVDAKLFSVMRGPDGKWYREDGTEANSVGDFKTAKGAAMTAGAVGGGLVADRAIMNRYGGGGSGMAVRGSAYRSAGRDLMESGRAMGGRAIDAGNDGFRAGQRSWRATKPGAIGNKAGNTGLFGRLRKALGKGLAVATGGKLKFSQEIKERVVELAEYPERKSRLQGAAVGGAIGAIGAGGAVGGLMAGATRSSTVMRHPIMQAGLRDVVRRHPHVERKARKAAMRKGFKLIPAIAAGQYGAWGMLGGAGIGALIGTRTQARRELLEKKRKANRNEA